MLVGDSHLARVRRDLRVIGPDVLNAARGGSTSLDLAAQTASVELGEDDVVVVSVGTNDAAPWKQVPPPDFERALRACLRALAPRPTVYVAPPGVDEDRLSGRGNRTNAVVDTYRRVALTACGETGARVVRADLLVQGLGSAAFTEDGVHLSGAAYGVLLPAIASACDPRGGR